MSDVFVSVGLGFHLLENSFVTKLLFMYTLLSVYYVHIVLCAFAYLSIPFSLIIVVGGLLGTCSMYLLVCSCAVYYIFSVCDLTLFLFA